MCKRMYHISILLSAVLLPYILSGCSRSSPSDETTNHEHMRTILETKQESAGRDAHKQPIFQALDALAKSQRMNPQDFTAYRTKAGFRPFFGGARAAQLSSGGKSYVVVIQTVKPMTMPGTSAQQLVLLSSQGKILDRVQCHINSRYGVIETQVKSPAEQDGAQLIIVFKGGANWWHNWHTITHRKTSRTFRERASGRPNVWDQRGLCRIKVDADRFIVLFPDLTNAEKGSKPDASGDR